MQQAKTMQIRKKCPVKKFVKNTFLCAIVLSSYSVVASTVVEFSGNNRADKIMTNGLKARIGTGSGDYVLVDYKTQSVKMILSAQKQVLDMGMGLPAKTTNAEIKTSLKAIGTGPVVAGYQTTAYAWLANGRNCGTIFASKAALNTQGVKSLFSALQLMMEKQRAAMGGYAAMMSVCMQANFKIANHISRVGIPMRMLKPDGQLENEIKSIKTDVKIAKSVFDVPASYKHSAMR